MTKPARFTDPAKIAWHRDYKRQQLARACGWTVEGLEAKSVKELLDAIEQTDYYTLELEPDLWFKKLPEGCTYDDCKRAVVAVCDVWQKFGTFYADDWYEALGIAEDDHAGRHLALSHLRLVGSVPMRRRYKKVLNARAVLEAERRAEWATPSPF